MENGSLKFKIIFIFAFFFLALVLPRISWAMTYYVATTGSDSNLGTQSQPWLTIQKAANTILAGDTVMVGAGTYNERIVFSAGHSGSAGNWIKFIASPLLSVNMRGFNTTNANYLHIEGFNINGAPNWWLGGGIWVASNNLEIIGNYFHDLIGPGILSSWVQPWAQNVHVANNKIYHCGAGIFVAGSNWLVEKNEVERLYNYTGSPDSDYSRFFGINITFKNNYFHGTLISEIGSSHTDGFQTFDNNGEYARNIVIDSNFVESFHEGMMLGVTYGRNSASNFIVKNNIFIDGNLGGAWGICSVAVQDLKVFNNVFYNMVYHGVGFTEGTTGQVKNNIFYNGGSNYWKDASSTLDGGFNILNRESYPYYKEVTDVVIDPKFSNSSNMLGADNVPFTNDDGYQLQQNSPAIDFGFSLPGIVNSDIFSTVRPQGSAWDTGAYEYVSATDTTPPLAPSGVSVS